MSAPLKILTPKTVREFPEYLDFERLRAEGIQHIQKLSGSIWTDHNSHDPGITLLEVLCYALTDLGYRTQLDFSELIAPTDTEGGLDTQFRTAEEVLTNNPLTILDYRKLLVDIEGVRNAWLEVAQQSDFEIIKNQNNTNDNPKEPALFVDLSKSELSFNKNTNPLIINGLYKILLELDTVYIKQELDKGLEVLAEAGNQKTLRTEQHITDEILKQVRQALHQHRNLCEDFLSIALLKEEKISLCADIEIAEKANPNDVLLGILEAVQGFLSPLIPFYTLNQMLNERGKTMDTIFEGRPLLTHSHGFVDTDDLEALEQRTEIHISDLYRLILGTEGVVAIKKLQLISAINPNKEGESWILPLKFSTHAPVLDAMGSASKINFSKRDVQYSTDARAIVQIFDKKLANKLKVLKQPYELNRAIEYGQPHPDLTQYVSIQNDLPANYGTAKGTFPSKNRTPAELIRQSQALQLKGYLLFFDRLLTNYLAQLGNLRHLLSTHLDPDADAVAALGNLNDVDILERLLPFDGNTRAAQLLRGQIPFQKGDSVAEIIEKNAQTGVISRKNFPTPQLRDTVLTQIIADFDADAVAEIYKKSPTDGKVRFFIESTRHNITLRSSQEYESEADARKALGAVRFLATLETSYQKMTVMPVSEHQYTFGWVFQFPDFQQFMRQSTESRHDYFRRKELVFNHLAARFAEDFTDYTLLMFGLSKDNSIQPTVETFAKDKKRFLDKYPDISRNRAKGLNQLLATPQYWANQNMSGLENRLGTLLDFNKNGKKQLNFFEIVADERVLMIFRDVRGQILLQAPQQLHPSEFENFKKQLRPDAPQTLHFEPYDNLAEQEFGFRVFLTEGGILPKKCCVAIHPDTYGSPSDRDAALRYTRLVLHDADRLPVDFVAIEAAFFAQILRGGHVILQAVQAADSAETARKIGWLIRQLARQKTNYLPTGDSQTGFGFQVWSPKTDTEQAILIAQNPQPLATIGERDAALSEIQTFLGDDTYRLTTQQLPKRQQWRVEENEQPILTSLHFFKTDAQTKAALLRTLEMFLDKKYRNYTFIFDKNKWFIQIFQRKSYKTGKTSLKWVKTPTAISAPFESQETAEQAVKSLLQKAEKALRILREQAIDPQDNLPICVEFHTLEGQHKAVLSHKTEGIQLEAISRHDNRIEAELAFEDILAAICNGQAEWLNTPVNGGCFHRFEVKIAGQTVATHPTLYDSLEKSSDAQHKISVCVCAFYAHIHTAEITKAAQWQLICPDGRAILRGSKNQNSVDETAVYFEKNIRSFLKNFQANTLSDLDSEGFSFVFKPESDILGEHPLVYPKAETRDSVKSKLANCLSEPTGDGFEISANNCHCTDSNGVERNADWRRWRVRDEHNCLATYFETFDDAQAAQTELKNVAKKYPCTPPQYSRIIIDNSTLWHDGYGTWRWVIRDDEQVYWQSQKGFDAEQKARTDFDEQVIKVIALAQNLQNFNVRAVYDNKTQALLHYILEVRDHRKQVVATALKHFSSETMAALAIPIRQQYAQFFPVYAVKMGEKTHYQFKIVQPTQIEGSLWQGQKTYPTWQEALTEFHDFADMLGFETHFHVIGADPCSKNPPSQYQIGITEVKLESREGFYTRQSIPNPNASDLQTANLAATAAIPNTHIILTADSEAENYAWQQVEQFLTAYQATDSRQAIRIYNDPADGGKFYRWAIIGRNYTPLRHPKAFHTMSERERQRDTLFEQSQNQLAPVASTINAQTIIDKLVAIGKAELVDALRNLDNFYILVEPPKTTFDPKNLVIGIRKSTFDSPFYLESPDFLEFSEKDLSLLFEVVTNLYILSHNKAFIATADKPDTEKTFVVHGETGRQRRTLDGLDKNTQYEFPIIEPLWESTDSFSNTAEQEGIKELYGELKTSKLNFIPTTATDGSFTISLADSEHILAYAPRRYPTRSMALAAAEHALMYVDTEGVHLLEHLLLRPRKPLTINILQTEQNFLLPIFLDEIFVKYYTDNTNKRTDYDRYIVNGDPYSMTATVVLPYWSRRFRNVDFREFFENTLRREAPAHVLLNILWITPQQMQAYEKRLRCWLETLAQSPLSDDFTVRTTDLIEILRGLKTTYPAAILGDCGDGLAPIILDKTTIG